MKKRKGKVARSGTLTPIEQRDGDARGEITDCKEGKGFFACYLLTSLSPRYKGHTYIGFTVNPRRRIRQHNGEIRSGAVRTKSRRPWDMVLCIYGFPTNVDALQFEWAWQHPTESLAVRKAAASFKSLSGIANKIKLAYTMLTLHSWQSMDLTVNFFSTKYMKYATDCPSLPEQMKVQIGYMDELICYSGIDQCAHVDEDDWDDGQGLSQMGTIGESSGEELVAVVDHSSVYLEGCTAVEMDVQMEFQENCLAEARDFFSPADDYTQLLCRIVSMDGKISSSGTNTFSKISVPEKAKNTDSYITVEEITEQSQEELPTIGVTDIMQPFSCGMVDVIDLFTPSPECSTEACSKKRRVSSSFPEIIDLTKSPVFVQL